MGDDDASGEGEKGTRCGVLQESKVVIVNAEARPYVMAYCMTMALDVCEHSVALADDKLTGRALTCKV
jgi:hypothetical protein